jgi:hypothetical protein
VLRVDARAARRVTVRSCVVVWTKLSFEFELSRSLKPFYPRFQA